MSVNEYITKFTQLSCYAPHEVNTDEKKHECFLNGLNDGLTYALEAQDFEKFHGMVNKALVLENHRGVMERKRSWFVSINWAVAPGTVLLRLQLDLCSVLLSRSFSQGRMQLDKDSLSHSVKGFSTPKNLQTPAAGNQSVQRTQATQDPHQADRRSYNCCEKGHYANRCPNSCIHVNQPGIATPTPTHGANSVPITAKQNYACERINHVAMKEAQEAPDIVIGMFLINDTSAIVLFDYGASHSFISAAYIGKHNLPLALPRCQMIISSPGGGGYARKAAMLEGQS
jgi:hypothetical protein